MVLLLRFSLAFFCASIIVALNAAAPTAFAFAPVLPHQQHQHAAPFVTRPVTKTTVVYMSDDWGSFSSLDDEDDDDVVMGRSIDKNEYATENDDDETKAAAGSSLKAPSILFDAEPIQVVAGSQLELSEETVLGILAACRGELGTIFGYTAENRGVGITGGVDFVEMDGPTVVVALKGRFWHERTTVLQRVANYLQQRIPEIIDVVSSLP